jgi:hypothetical protein
VIAHAISEKPTRNRFAIPGHVQNPIISMVRDLLNGKTIQVSRTTIEVILEIDGLLELTSIRPLLNEIAEKELAVLREIDGLEKVQNFQAEVDQLEEETFTTVANMITKNFQNDGALWQSIVETAKDIRLQNDALYRRLFEAFGLTMKRPPTFSSSEFLDIIKADNLERFVEEWQAFPAMANAVPLPPNLRESVERFHYLMEGDCIDPLPIACVVAFYGAEKCFRFLMATESIDVLCFAVAGGSINILTLFDITEREVPLLVIFACFYHQTELFN